MRVDPISWILLAVGIAVGAGAAAAGDALVDRGRERHLVEQQRAMAEEHTAQLEAALATQVVEAQSDANVVDKLADEPPSCWLMRHAESREERDSLRLDCAVAMCWSYGLQAQQRPECQQLQQALVERASCVEAGPSAGGVR